MFDAETKFAAMDERVSNLGRQVITLEHSTREGFAAIGARMETQSRETTAALSAIQREITSGSKTPWPVIWSAMGVCVGILGLIGALVYTPIRDDATELKAAIIDIRKAVDAQFSAVTANVVARQEIDWRASRAAEDRARTEQTLKTITDQMMPRLELDARLVDHQRQIDQIRSALNRLDRKLPASPP